MRYRAFVSGSTVAVVLAVWALVAVPLTGQTQAVAPRMTAKSRTPPRTPWGKPDLQGTWDFRTVTPLERPAELAGKEVLTAAEAAELRRGPLYAPTATVTSPLEMSETTTSSGTTEARRSPELGVRH